jgi:DNA repair photolyase
MTITMKLENINATKTDIYNLEGFKPEILDEKYLHKLGVRVNPSEETLKSLMRGSAIFKERMQKGIVIPRPELEIEEIDLNQELEVHNYTGACPTLTYEINPVAGCNVGCLYCLVTDGEHVNKMKAYSNYHLLVRKILEEKWGEPHYYYFSPKTEAFQEPTLQTGIAHNILREFINHFEKHPDSKARLFIASKAGSRQLLYSYEGETILELFVKLKDRMQFNTSVSIMPPELRGVLEPFAASIEERLKAVSLCQEQGIMADSALVQPIVASYLTEENMKDFFERLKGVNIVNFKPEFLTACMENLAMIGQLLGYYDRAMERELYEYYIAPENIGHRKQRGRTAPSRVLSREHLRKLMETSSRYGLTVSICYWVRKQLDISEEVIPVINKNGFQCLGYQTRLFDK